MKSVLHLPFIIKHSLNPANPDIINTINIDALIPELRSSERTLRSDSGLQVPFISVPFLYIIDIVLRSHVQLSPHKVAHVYFDIDEMSSSGTSG